MPGKYRGPKQTPVRPQRPDGQTARYEREEQAVQLKREGLTYEAIVSRLQLRRWENVTPPASLAPSPA